MPIDKILNATFSPEGQDLIWIEAPDHDDDGTPYRIWLLIQCETEKVIASVEGPTPRQLTYQAGVDGLRDCKFISLEAAQRHCVREAHKIIQTAHEIEQKSAKCAKISAK